MNLNEKGYFILYRKIFMDESEWLSEPFTKSQALIDLFNLMHHNHEPTTKKFKKGRVIAHIQRGQGAFTERELAERWRWSKSKVRVFLNNQTTTTERPNCNLRKNQHFTLITFCNYEELCRLPNDKKPIEKPNYDQRTTKERPLYIDNGNTTKLPNDYLSNPKEREIEKGGMGEKTKTTKISLSDLSIEHIAEWLKEKNIPADFALKKLDDLKGYCNAKGATYKNYIAAWQNFIRKDFNNQPKGKQNDKLQKTQSNAITTSGNGQNAATYLTIEGKQCDPNNPLHQLIIKIDREQRAEQANIIRE
jgi:hypothetical protein